jgi:hypothetical protein
MKKQEILIFTLAIFALVFVNSVYAEDSENTKK